MAGSQSLPALIDSHAGRHSAPNFTRQRRHPVAPAERADEIVHRSCSGLEDGSRFQCPTPGRFSQGGPSFRFSWLGQGSLVIVTGSCVSRIVSSTTLETGRELGLVT